MAPPPAGRSAEWGPGLGGLAGMLALPAVLAVLFYVTPADEWLGSEHAGDWRSWVEIHRALAWPVFGLIFAAFSATGLPRIYPTMLAGTLLGPASAMGLALVGGTAGALAGFQAAHALGRRRLEARLGGVGRRWLDQVGRGGFVFVMMLRLLPGTNAMLTNMVAGVSGMPAGRFALATVLGIAPSSLAFVYLGRGLATGEKWMLFGAFGVLVALAGAGLLLWRRRRAG